MLTPPGGSITGHLRTAFTLLKEVWQGQTRQESTEPGAAALQHEGILFYQRNVLLSVFINSSVQGGSWASIVPTMPASFSGATIPHLYSDTGSRGGLSVLPPLEMGRGDPCPVPPFQDKGTEAGLRFRELLGVVVDALHLGD